MRRIARPNRLLLVLAALSVLGACRDGEPPLFPVDAAQGLGEQASPERGARLIAERGCTACHTVPGVRGPASRVGPPLGNLARQAYVAGLLPNTPDNLVRWLMDPPAVNPRTAMPDMGLQRTEAEDIAAYLMQRADRHARTP